MIIDLERVRKGDALLRKAHRLYRDKGSTPRPVPLEEVETMAIKQVYTVAEAAELLGMNEQTIRRWCREGKIETANIGGHYRISRPALAAFWRSQGGGRLFDDTTTDIEEEEE